MDFVISGLKCDNPNCDYCNADISFLDYPKYINYPCPKCGESLLTPQSYRSLVAMKSLGNFITKLTGDAKEKDAQMYIPLDMDAHGNVSMKK